MKKLIVLLFVLLLMSSCSIDEVQLPVKAFFKIEVIDADFSAPVKVLIYNQTKNADTYNWSFDGALTQKSDLKKPGVIVYEKPGSYDIVLEAKNRDGSVDTHKERIQVIAPVKIDFNTEVIDNNFSPMKLKIINKTKGATSYNWTFENGVPSSSNKQFPEYVVFSKSGPHTITLSVSNGVETYELKKTITVAPNIVADFDYSIPFENDDYQIPVKLKINNKSVSANSFRWYIDDKLVKEQDSLVTNTQITILESGKHIVKLIASNGKQEQEVSKLIEVFENTNLRTYENIIFGTNTAHKNNSYGAFFSLSTRKVYSKDQLNDENSPLIDLIFFGLNDAFLYNKFISPKQASDFSFKAIKKAKNTIFINSFNKLLSVSEFDEMSDDRLLRTLNIVDKDSSSSFDNKILPRIILFKTSNGLIGAVKIKEFISLGLNSHIVTDIKVQKQKTTN